MKDVPFSELAINKLIQRCSKKRVHYTAQAAKQAKKASAKTFGVPMRFYKCNLCGYWHVATKKTPGKEQESKMLFNDVAKGKVVLMPRDEQLIKEFEAINENLP